MALSSQSGRPMSRHSYMSSRRHSRRGRYLVLLVLVVCGVGIAYWAMPFGSQDSETQTSETNTLATEIPETNSAKRIIDSTSNTPRTITLKNSSEQNSPTTNTPRKATGTTKSTTTPRVASKPLPTQPTPLPKSVTPAPMSTPVQGRGSANTTTSQASSQTLQRAYELKMKDPVEARRLVTDAWVTGQLNAEDKKRAAILAEELSEIVLFDKRIVANDPFSTSYTIQANDALERIVRKQDVKTEWLFVARINGITNPNLIRPGQKLKIPVGSFHAVVNKDQYRLDLYQDNGDERVLVKCFDVGLGEFGSTPTGLFRVDPGSKLIDPEWINPRNRKKYSSSDPANPIGEHWIGIKGMEKHNKDLQSFGIHGTIDPDSIGKDMSMGCIRLRPKDVELIYEVVTQGNSTIEINGNFAVATEIESETP